MPTTTTEPRFDQRPEKPYIGIRTQTQFKGMFKVIDKLFKELHRWMDEKGVKSSEPPFLRYHVIDMEGEMDIEVGRPVAGDVPTDDRVKAGVLPAGRYASLVYVGNGYTGNKTLIEWGRDNGIPWDKWDDPKGDGFRCRIETYFTDTDIEPRKTKWEIEVAIKVKDESLYRPFYNVSES